MKNEDAFNAYLSKELKKLAPEFKVLKLCEKYHIGVSDFMLIRGGVACFFETKFLRDDPFKTAGQVLKHPFSGAQMTFLKSMRRAGAMSYGVVYHDYSDLIWVYEVCDLPERGNWFSHEFGWQGHSFARKDILGLANHLMHPPKLLREGPSLD